MGDVTARDVQYALAVLRQGLGQIGRMPPSKDRTDAIRYLATELDALREAIAPMRQSEVLRLWHESQERAATGQAPWTGGEIARMTGLTRARVHQLKPDGLATSGGRHARPGPPDRPQRQPQRQPQPREAFGLMAAPVPEDYDNEPNQ